MTALSTEGLSVQATMRAGLFSTGLLLSVALGVAAGLVPAWQASRRPIVESFRAV